ncbi:hypothetical protein CEK25_012834 [Fusarium fujikuroi]|nr:hypothetical protein CEK25_012834 [Fusarium fujikuroi]
MYHVSNTAPEKPRYARATQRRQNVSRPDPSFARATQSRDRIITASSSWYAKDQNVELLESTKDQVIGSWEDSSVVNSYQDLEPWDAKSLPAVTNTLKPRALRNMAQSLAEAEVGSHEK